MRRAAESLIVLCLTGGGLVLAGPAQGATYTVNSCTNALNPGIAGWRFASAGSFLGPEQACSQGGSFGGWLASDVSHNPEDHATFVFDAPSATSIVGIRALRSAEAGPYQVNGNPSGQLLADGQIVEVCSRYYGCSALQESPIAFTFSSAHTLTFGAFCANAAGCPPGATSYKMRQVQTDLNDESDPILSTPPSGPLTDPKSLDRLRTLTYAASDQGGGVYRQRLIVDGAVAPPEVVNDNDTKCAVPFRNPVPCRTSATNASVSLDTATLSDGAHTIQLDVRDATDVNKVQTSPWQIVVDNVPPAVGAVQVTGTAREGDALTCSATAAGQSPTMTYAWLRANADGSGAEVIPGATIATYEQKSADIGKKVICRASGTDHGGTTARDSGIAEGPFANGAVVATYCTGRPTGPTDECGDFDGDGALNRVDADDDNDGIPDSTDIAPLDASIPATDTPAGPQGPAGTPGGAGNPGAAGGSGDTGGGSSVFTLFATDLNTIAMLRNPVSQAGANGSPAAGDALLAVRFAIGSGARLRTSTRVVAAYGQGLSVRGTLQTPANRPVTGARVYLVQRPMGGDDGAWRLDKAAVTASDGSFSLPVERGGRNRDIRVVYFPQGGSNVNRGSNALTLQVRQDATFAVSTRRLHNGGRLVFRGRVLGTVPTGGIDVRVQVRLGRSWYTFTKLTTTRSKGGRFRASHRFTETTSATTYRFRILVLPRDRHSYASGFSRPIDVRVLP